MSDDASPVRSLLIPVSGEDILLPGAVVAEVTGYVEPEGDGSPEEGIIGTATWRGQRLPVASLTGLGEDGQREPGARARLVVLKGVSNHPELPYFGIVADDIPRPLSVQAQTIESLSHDDLPEGMLACVLANGEPAYIPDVEALEAKVHRALARESKVQG